MSDAVHMVTVQITEQLLRQTYSEHCQTCKMERFARRIMPECRCTARYFSGQKEGKEKVCGTRTLR